MLAEHKRLVSDLKDQYADAHDWNLRYKAAFKGIHGSELGTCINAVQKPLELGKCTCYIDAEYFFFASSVGPPGHEPAVNFLSSTGLSQAVDAVSCCLCG